MTKTTIKVKFRPSTVVNQPGSIIYLVTRHRIVRQITTDNKVFPDEWDGKSSKVVINRQDRKEIVQHIGQHIIRDIECLDRIITGLKGQYREYSSDDVVAEFRRVTKENTLFRFMGHVITRLQTLQHTGTARNYRATLNSFKRFRFNEDVALESIDNILIEDYQAYLKSKGLAPNSITFYIRILRAVYNRAVENGLTSDRHPFRTVSTGMEKTLKRAISFTDIRRIKNLDLSSKPNLEFARDIFMFLFYCRGMSFIDAAYLKKTDIQNGLLSYRRHKTEQLLHIKIIKPIVDLLNRYKTNDSPYLLPIISNHNGNERRHYESALRHINNGLKTIADMINLSIPLTTYVARHTWATVAKSKNVSVNVISDALGHDSIITTQVYLASIDTSVIDQANDLIIRDL